MGIACIEMGDKVLIRGNIERINEVNELLCSLHKSGKTVSEIQKEVKSVLVNKYGVDFYESSKEALNYIIECYYN